MMNARFTVAFLAALGLVQPVSAQFGFVDTDERTLAYGDTYVSTNLVRMHVKSQNIGWYSISGWFEDGKLDSTVEVQNNSDCELTFEGTFFSGSDPVGFISWGRGSVILPGESIKLKGEVYAPTVDLDSPLRFVPNGYTGSCE